jgi:hypothetical protein
MLCDAFVEGHRLDACILLKRSDFSIRRNWPSLGLSFNFLSPIHPIKKFNDWSWSDIFRTVGSGSQTTSRASPVRHAPPPSLILQGSKSNLAPLHLPQRGPPGPSCQISPTSPPSEWLDCKGFLQMLFTGTQARHFPRSCV